MTRQMYTTARSELTSAAAATGLAAMQSGGACVQLAFMDDGHKFDDNVVELHMLGLMMPVLGVLVIDGQV